MDSSALSEDGLRLEGCPALIGRSPQFRHLLEDLLLISSYDVNVLIEGETGTGKDLLARALHKLSPRRQQPFVSLNCAALPNELAESELFGHGRGAFTHAYENRIGIIAEAENGTLFLDEVSSLDLSLQAKLLRFLQDGEYRQLGTNRLHNSDVRVIAASNKPLPKEVEEGRFRSDLYFRIAVYQLAVPSLRERHDDIDLLVRHFLAKHSKRLRIPPCRLSADILSCLASYHWPGNLRELENQVQRFLIRKSGAPLTRADLPPHITSASRPPEAPNPQFFKEAKAEMVRRFEYQYFYDLMTTHRGNITRAAETAGIHRRALTALLQKHGIERNSFKAALRARKNEINHAQ
jgi:DNA-binding NtrC family response regulator